jgi:uncharacterized protein YodC (DUF2158 family)
MSEKKEIEVGDTVRLKSGGPLMTVTEIEDRQGVKSVFCVWFEKNKQDKGAFPLATVTYDDGVPFIG